MQQGHRLSIAISCVDIVRDLYANSQGIRVITGDTCGKAECVNIKQASQVLQSLVGGGGTDMAAIMNQAIGSRPRPQLLIVATDIDTPWPTQQEMGRTPVIICGCNSYEHKRHLLPTWADYIEITDNEWEQLS